MTSSSKFDKSGREHFSLADCSCSLSVFCPCIVSAIVFSCDTALYTCLYLILLYACYARVVQCIFVLDASQK